MGQPVHLPLHHILKLCAGILWTGHNDGKICAFALDAKPGVALTGRTLNSWQAHRIGSVTVLLTTPWGELWSGSSRGIIRVWRNAHKSGGGGLLVTSSPLVNVHMSGLSAYQGTLLINAAGCVVQQPCWPDQVVV